MDAEDKANMNEVSKSIGETVTTLARLAEDLKGADWLNLKDQLEMVAGSEMKKAADRIAEAADRLTEMKKNQHINKEVGYDLDCLQLLQGCQETIKYNDELLDGVQAITLATASLITAATAAQNDLVSVGKVKEISKKVCSPKPSSSPSSQGSADSQWSRGLVSAAEVVASVTVDLCEAANTSMQVLPRHSARAAYVG